MSIPGAKTIVAGTPYTYTVQAINAAGNTSAEITASATTMAQEPPPDIEAPSAPSGLTAILDSGFQPNLVWTASTDNIDVTGYHVYRDATIIATVPYTNWYNFFVSYAPHTYTETYTVKAFDDAGNISTASNAVTVTIPGSENGGGGGGGLIGGSAGFRLVAATP